LHCPGQRSVSHSRSSTWIAESGWCVNVSLMVRFLPARPECSPLARNLARPGCSGHAKNDLADDVSRTETLVRLCRLLEREGRAGSHLQPGALDGLVESRERLRASFRVVGDDLDPATLLRRRLDAV